jgi:acylphosphatase
MEETKVLYKIVVTGRVQGVGFRQSCLREARYLGISGYVKNLPDGSVYIEAEGTPGTVSLLVDWCRHGPVFGSTEDISVEIGKPVNHKLFIIRY